MNMTTSRQIRDAERQVQRRQQQIGVRAHGFARSLRLQMASPTVLLLAGGAGFVFGELTRPTPACPGQPSASARSPLWTALDLINSAQAVYAALPPSWIQAFATGRRHAKPDCPAPPTTRDAATPRQTPRQNAAG